MGLIKGCGGATLHSGASKTSKKRWPGLRQKCAAICLACEPLTRNNVGIGASARELQQVFGNVSPLISPEGTLALPAAL
jgi:hypothetical protein